MISHLPTLPTGRQAQAGITKNDYRDLKEWLNRVRLNVDTYYRCNLFFESA